MLQELLPLPCCLGAKRSFFFFFSPQVADRNALHAKFISSSVCFSRMAVCHYFIFAIFYVPFWKYIFLLSLVLPNKFFTMVGSVAGREKTEVYVFLPTSQGICACRHIHAFTERFWNPWNHRLIILNCIHFYVHAYALFFNRQDSYFTVPLNCLSVFLSCFEQVIWFFTSILCLWILYMVWISMSTFGFLLIYLLVPSVFLSNDYISWVLSSFTRMQIFAELAPCLFQLSCYFFFYQL